MREVYKPGTEVYYTGDMANPDGFGKIVEVLAPDPRYGVPIEYVVELEEQHTNHCKCTPGNIDDGCLESRKMYFYTTAFDGPGARLKLKSQYLKEREESIARSREELIRKGLC